MTAIKPVILKCEYTINPLGIDSLNPRLSWIPESDLRGQVQTAYHILAAGSEEKLGNNSGDLWDTGKVNSGQSTNVIYEGKKLLAGMRCWWKVRIWDRNGDVSEFSEVSGWEMGLLDRTDWEAKWIGADKETASKLSAPLLRKEVTIDKKVKNARLYVCGLGYYELRINGMKVGDHVLDPGFTNYSKRVLYATYDVTSCLKKGRNAIGVELGRGFYGVTTEAVWEFHRAPWHDDPKLLLQMNVRFDDDSSISVKSDFTWKISEGPTVFDSIYCGETYDAGKEKNMWDMPLFDDSAWNNARLVDMPSVILSAQMQQPIKIIESIKPEKITSPGTGVYVYHFPRNVTGWVRLSTCGPVGSRVVLKYGEKLFKNGTVDSENGNIYMPMQTDTYILKGDGIEIWEPKFSYKGFQYIEVTGFPGIPSLDSLYAKLVRSSVEPAGRFDCSNQLFNKIHENTCNSILNNLHSIPTDTPAYEKNGWLGDAQLIAETAIYNFDMARLFSKWIRDIKDCQTEEGKIPVIVPNGIWGLEWDSPEWGVAYIIIPWALYHYYDDKTILEEYYNEMKKYVDYEISRLKNYISSGFFGDWLPPGVAGMSPPEGADLSSTAYVYFELKVMAEIAKILGKEDDKKNFTETCINIKTAFNDTFLDKGENIYHTSKNVGYRQTSNILPLAFGMVPDENRETVVKNLVKDIDSMEGHLSTGILGTRFILPVLTEYGYGDTAYTIANQDTYPGWGYWIANGATTNWEHWELTSRSHDHYMFGTIDEWFYKYIAGVSFDDPGIRTIKIKPYIICGLTSASAQIETVKGVVSSSWVKNSDGTFKFDIKIPVNSSATIYIPAKNSEYVMEGGIPAIKAECVLFLRMENGYAVFTVKAGSYSFASYLTKPITNGIQ